MQTIWSRHSGDLAVFEGSLWQHSSYDAEIWQAVKSWPSVKRSLSSKAALTWASAVGMLDIKVSQSSSKQLGSQFSATSGATFTTSQSKRRQAGDSWTRAKSICDLQTSSSSGYQTKWRCGRAICKQFQSKHCTIALHSCYRVIY
jgi:hypothetical protein